MIKVHILAPCTICNGQAYLPVGEAESVSGEPYTRYIPCSHCQGSGHSAQWVSLRDFLDLLDAAALEDPMQPDYALLAQQLPVSQYHDSRDAAGI